MKLTPAASAVLFFFGLLVRYGHRHILSALHSEPDPDPSIYENVCAGSGSFHIRDFCAGAGSFHIRDFCAGSGSFHIQYENFWPDPNNYSDLDLDSTTFYLVQKIVIKELQKS